MKTWDQTTKIMNLFAELDAIPFEEPTRGTGAFWIPESPKGKEVFAQLVAPENRQALRLWYEQLRETELNPSAEQVRKTLEQATGEKFT